MQADTYKQTFDELNGRISILEAQLVDQEVLIEDMEVANSTINEINDQLDEIESMVADISDKQNEFQSELDEDKELLESLAGQQTEITTSLDELGSDLEASSSDLAYVFEEFSLLKVMQLVGRARFNLGTENLSLAATDLQTAREILEEMHNSASENGDSGKVEILEEMLARLDKARDTLTNSPLLAADYLESLWQILLVGFEDVDLQAEESDLTLETTATPAEPAETPTPTPTPSP